MLILYVVYYYWKNMNVMWRSKKYIYNKPCTLLHIWYQCGGFFLFCFCRWWVLLLLVLRVSCENYVIFVASESIFFLFEITNIMWDNQSDLISINLLEHFWFYRENFLIESELMIMMINCSRYMVWIYFTVFKKLNQKIMFFFFDQKMWLEILNANVSSHAYNLLPNKGT